MRKAKWAVTLACSMWAASAGAADAHVIVAAVIAVASAVATAVATVVGALSSIVGFGAFQGLTWAAAGRWLLRTALYYGISKLLGGKSKGAASVAERQASVLELDIGEVPREGLLGMDATAGSFVDGFNFGDNNEWETVVIAVADHPCAALVGYYVGDAYYAFVNQGDQAAFNNESGQTCLEIFFQDGNQTSVHWRLINSDPRVGDERWQPTDVGYGVSHVIVSYRYDDKVWPQGRPLQQFRWVLRGALLYDARKDSTVAGGSGPHRWGSTNTYEWTDNWGVCSSNFRWGIWTRGQRICGPARSFDEAPVADAIVAANIAAESVTLNAGGSEARYRVGAVIRDAETWIDVEQDFADAAGGVVVERAGAISIDAGVARTSVATFTDDDLSTGSEISYQAKLPRDQLVNSVSASYADPDTLYEEASVPLRRSLDDFAADGEIRELALPLRFVRSGTQAQRIAEIKRRLSRRQRSARVTLGPKFMRLEPGDWVTWNSNRYFGGADTIWVVTGVDLDQYGKVSLALREINATVFSWTAATDELANTRPTYLSAASPAAAVIDNFVAEMIEIPVTGGTRPVGMRLTWNAAAARRDARITAIKIEYRVLGAAVSLSHVILDEDSGLEIISGLEDFVTYEARAVPIARGFTALPTAWREVAALRLLPLTPPAPLSFVGYQLSDGARFVAEFEPWAVPLELEIRAGALWDTARTIYRGAALATPPLRDPPPADGSNRYWARTVAEGYDVYSETGLLFDLDVAQLPNRNEFLTFNFQDDDWPGVVDGFTRIGTPGAQSLSMDAPDGIRPPYADYYQSVDLEHLVSARWYWLSLTAGRDLAPPIPYGDLDLLSYSDLESWYPYATTEPVTAAQIVSYIATDTSASDFIDGATLNSTSLSVNGVTAIAFFDVTYSPAVRGYGAEITDESRLAWTFAVPSTFRSVFDIAPDAAWSADKVLMKAISDTGDWLRVRYDDSSGMLVAEDSAGGFVEVAAPLWDIDETYSIAISQDGSTRRIAWASFGGATTSASGLVAPIGALDRVHIAGAGGIFYEELDDYSYAGLAGLSYDDLSGKPINAAGVVADLELFSGALTDDLEALLGDRSPAGMSEYRLFEPADYRTRRASVKLRLNVDPGYGEPVKVDSAEIMVDVEDLTDHGSASVLAAGTRINFARTFNIIPEVVANQIAGASIATVQITNRDKLGFTATAYNNSNVGVDASISWAALGW